MSEENKEPRERKLTYFVSLIPKGIVMLYSGKESVKLGEQSSKRCDYCSQATSKVFNAEVKTTKGQANVCLCQACLDKEFKIEVIIGG